MGTRSSESIITMINNKSYENNRNNHENDFRGHYAAGANVSLLKSAIFRSDATGTHCSSTINFYVIVLD